MLTEDFLKIILKFIFCDVETNDSDIQTDAKVTIFNNIYEIIQYYNDKKKPISLIELFNVVKTLVDKIIKNHYEYNKNIIKDSVNISDSINNYINYLISNKITSYEYVQIVEHISDRNKYIKMFMEKDEYFEFVKNVENGNYTDINTVVKEYEELLNKIYFDFSLNKNNIIDTDKLLTNKNFPKEVTVDENIIESFNNMSQYYSNVSTVRSGFKYFDDYYSMNGFESGRIYLGAAPPGFGKSLWLLSSAVKACKFYDTPEGEREMDPGTKNVFIYITAENQIYETLIRYGSMVIDSKPVTTKELVDSSELSKNDREQRQKELYFKNSIIEIKYVSGYNTTTGDIMVLIDKVMAKYDPKIYKLRCIYVDYLDLIKSMQKTEMYRMELGFVTMELKNIGIRYNTPVVTVTQLNDHTVDSVKNKPKLSMLKESKAKGEHADCVFVFVENESFMQINNDDEKIIDVCIIKNRGYKKGTYSIYVNFDYKKLISCDRAGNVSHETEYIPSYVRFERKYRKLISNIYGNSQTHSEPQQIVNEIATFKPIKKNKKEEGNSDNINEFSKENKEEIGSFDINELNEENKIKDIDYIINDSEYTF